MTEKPRIARRSADSKRFGEISLEGVVRVFPPNFTALDAVSVAFRRGEIHMVLGENGAGKSTLVSLLSGMGKPDAGHIAVDGKPVIFASSADSLRSGVAIVHQRPLLCDGLTVLENAALGLPGLRLRRGARAEALERIESDWGIALDIKKNARDLSPRERLLAALLAALIRDPSFLILDEPTAVLEPDERDRFMETLARKRAEGLGVIVITHKLMEAVRWANRVTVLKRGKIAFTATAPLAEAELAPFFGASRATANAAMPTMPSDIADEGRVSFRVEGIAVDPANRPALKGVSFFAQGGQITGVFGHPGSGIDVLEDALCGMIAPSAGTISLARGDGERVTLDAASIAPNRLREAGIGFVPANRTFRGSNPALSIRDVLASCARLSRPSATANAERVLRAERIEAAPTRRASTLSGGQLQRLILDRELENNPRVLVLSNPEWGLDIASVYRFRERIAEAANAGMAIIVLTDSADAISGSSLYSRVWRLEEGKIS